MKPVKITVRGVEKWMIDLRKYGQGRKFFPTEEAAKAWWRDYEKKTFKHGPSLAKMDQAERDEMVAWWNRFKSLKKPYKLLIEIENKLARIPFLPDAMQKFLEMKKNGGRSDRYVTTLKQLCRHFSAMYPRLRPYEISPEHIDAWFSGRNLKPGTIKVRIGDLRTFFSFSMKRGWCESNPCNRLDPIRIRRKPPGILSVEDINSLFLTTYRNDRSLCPWLALATFCGIRMSELHRLKEENVWVERGLVEISAEVSKTSRRRLVNISSNCKEWLLLGLEIPPLNLRRRFEQVRRQAGLFNRWHRNVLRHSGASYLLAMTENAHYTSLQMGHSVEMLQVNYRALVTKDQAERFFAIEPPKALTDEGSNL